jgi:RNA polymerase sigma-32 factor
MAGLAEDEDADQAADLRRARRAWTSARELLAEAMDVLNERERDILTQRRLQDSR